MAEELMPRYTQGFCESEISLKNDGFLVFQEAFITEI
jgi:hypothetical protein